ncbi:MULTISPECIES: TetR/AcrR family transcriptional regulator [unclassified Streptomyces]|uniref:TetR/AcrR family transcriptional regulator n=1 Tax=unclassified Streptomyces TaxID=2593676 RepID=UPI0006FC3C59|nr:MULTISPECIES: TetR/AcrR family transcriptional regulator [unclassified Streptomyces]KQX54946.1 TetR family transcriptional regulator [Streptomyces sp. Root1304]KRA94464.1 TetR family transcriptional regulator [Streptomyces sp. Root66D1]
MADEPTGKSAGGGQTRRRGAALEEAILRAAAEELVESGYAGLTMDRVARRAGTNKNAIYRRWPNRLALGVAGYRRLATSVQPPDTGELRSDALELLRGANRHWSSPLGTVLRELMAAAGGATEFLAQLPEQAGDSVAATWLTVLGRAVARGEAAPEALHPRVATVAVVLLRNEFVVRGVPTAPDEVLVEIVDEVYLPLVRRRGTAAG